MPLRFADRDAYPRGHPWSGITQILLTVNLMMMSRQRERSVLTTVAV